MTTKRTRLMSNGYLAFGNNILVHRDIASKALGRPLTSIETVHHIDGNKLNNDPTNLVICPNDSYHQLLHARQRIFDLDGHPDIHAYCTYHKCLHLKEEFSTVPSRWNTLHNTCRAATNEYRKSHGLNVDKFDWRARLNQQYRRIAKGYTNRLISWISQEGRGL